MVGRVVRVALVVDEALSRAALAQGLEADPRVAVLHRLGGRREALDRVDPRTVDVLVVEEALADGTGVELGMRLQERDPDLAVLLLSGRDASDVVLALRGRTPRPWSHVSRRACPDPGALARAVVATADGQAVLGPGPGPGAAPAGVAGLTAAQGAVLALVAQGLSNRAAARVLGLSPRSVENHLAVVYRALGAAGPDVSPRVLAALAYRTGAAPRAAG
ncbi:response regulator transcription factor [Cellulomonas sp. ACRRI]|uniref:response regulator transcription factor n=1 Tax=Cellulomonas sp. ACRRI TaxID=2918188 RepID=UPI001EF2F2CF|nr:response regulator transcription factor [Cellulomonas sp. ACRRI]MCG7287687.1 response regulator transcription factor [Cellulomonas sp. ACRRI]